MGTEKEGALMTKEMSVAEAMIKAREYADKDKDLPSVSRTLAAEITQLRGNLSLAEAGLAAAMQEIQGLTRDMAALQSQWDDMQQGFVEVFGEPVQDAIELLGATERLRSSHEPSVGHSFAESYRQQSETNQGGVDALNERSAVKSSAGLRLTPSAWMRGVSQPGGPWGPPEYDWELVAGDDPPEGTGWVPLYLKHHTVTPEPLPAAKSGEGK
jgi:hypothetical protein